MANHKVIMREPKKLLRKKDVELMGTLMVSRGGLDYRAAHGKKPYTRPWKDIHEFFTGEKWKKTGVRDEFDDSDVD